MTISKQLKSLNLNKKMRKLCTDEIRGGGGGQNEEK
jgi:hypothetical protein